MMALIPLADSVTNTPYAGPGAMVLAGIAGLAAAARYYMLARREAVEYERKRRVEAETREEASGQSMSAKVDDLKKQIDSLEKQIKEMRTQSELRALELIGKNFSLRELLREHGIAIPEELGPS
jgi:TolA-binding protein